MDIIRSVLCFIALGVLSANVCAMIGQYVRNVVLDGYIDETNIIRTSNATSVIDCAKRCTGSSECAAFFYTSLSKECREHSQLSDVNMFGLISRPGTRYYHVAITLTESFVCPVLGGNWVTGQLPNGSLYQFRAFMAGSATQSDAYALCQSFGANLPQLTTIEKMDFYRNNIVGICPGIQEVLYWVDGSNSEAINYNANDAYTTQNGNVLHLTSGLWGTNRPNRPDIEHCVKTDQNLNYMLNDGDCELVFPTIICEKKISAK